MARMKTEPNPLLLRAEECADLLRIDRSTWLRHVAGGRAPRSIKIGGSVRWSRKTLERWIELECPRQKDFETLTGMR